jgi:hypothetical protein
MSVFEQIAEERGSEQKFQSWYSDWADKTGISPDPDDPRHKYDYRAAHIAGAEPKISSEDGLYHWPSEFKADDHPNRFVSGVDTKTGKPSTDIFEQIAKERSDIFGEIASERKAEWKKAMDDFAKGSDVFKKYKGLAKDPMKIIEGGIEFGSALPGFFAGLVGASQNVIKGFLGGGNDIEDLYNLAAEGFEREGAKMPAYDFGHEDTHLVGETFMAPALTIMHGGHKIADKIDDPNAKGAIRFASDILGLVAQGKALHGKGKAKIELPKEAPKLDTTFAKDEINIRRAKESAIPQKPLDKLKRQEDILRMEREGFESETPRAQRAQDVGKAFEKEIPFTKDIEGFERKVKPYEKPPEIVEPGKTYDPEYLLRTATERVGGKFKKGEIEGVKETPFVREPPTEFVGEYGLKIKDRSVLPEPEINKAVAIVNNLTKEGKSAKDAADIFAKYLNENRSMKGKIELFARLKTQEIGSKLEIPTQYELDPEVIRRAKNKEFFKKEAKRLGIWEEDKPQTIGQMIDERLSKIEEQLKPKEAKSALQKEEVKTKETTPAERKPKEAVSPVVPPEIPAQGKVQKVVEPVIPPKKQKATKTEVIKRFENKEDGIAVDVAKVDRGYSVVLQDLDSGNYLSDTIKIYKTAGEAIKKAKSVIEQSKITEKPKPKESEITQGIKTQERIAKNRGVQKIEKEAAEIDKELEKAVETPEKQDLETSKFYEKLLKNRTNLEVLKKAGIKSPKEADRALAMMRNGASKSDALYSVEQSRTSASKKSEKPKAKPAKKKVEKIKPIKPGEIKKAEDIKIVIPDLPAKQRNAAFNDAITEAIEKAPSERDLKIARETSLSGKKLSPAVLDILNKPDMINIKIGKAEFNILNAKEVLEQFEKQAGVVSRRSKAKSKPSPLQDLRQLEKGFKKAVGKKTSEITSQDVGDYFMAKDKPKLGVNQKGIEIAKRQQTRAEFYNWLINENISKEFRNKLRKDWTLNVIKDVNTALGKRGSIDPKETLTAEQQAAMMRLKGDLDVIKKNAKKTGKTIEKYLVDLGYDPKVASILQKNSEEIPKYAKSINLERQDIPEDYKRFELDLLGGEKKKVQTWDQTKRLSEKYLEDVDKGSKMFSDAKAGRLKFNRAVVEKSHAMRQINVNAIDGLKEVLNKGDREQMNESLKNYTNNIARVTSDMGSTAGRLLNSFKMEVSILRLGRALSKLKDGLNERQFAELQKLNTENPVEVKNFIRRLEDPKLSDYFLEYWYNSILSGPPTHGVNMAGNTLWITYQVPHRVHTALIDKPYSALTGKERSYFINEIVPMLAGYKSGFKKGKKAAGEMMRSGKISSFEDKWALEMGSALSAFERSPNKALRKIGRFITPPTRALRAVDVWANAIGFDGEVRSMARRASNKEGLKGKERETFEKEFAENLTREEFDKAQKQAKHGTFMDDPDPLTQAVIRARSVPVVGPALRFTAIPFVNTISNLTKRGVELTPGLGIVKEAVSRGMGRGRPTPDVIAKQIEGAVIAVYVMNKVEKGEITGPMPEKRSEREAWHRQKKKPWAIKLGDTWFQYRRYEPFNTAIGSVAIGYGRIKEAMQNGEEDKATEIFSDIANGIKWNILDGSYFSGLQSIFKRHDKNITEGAAKFAASWVPYSSFWRSMNRSYEVWTEGSAKVREGNDWIKAFSSTIPGLSGKMPAKLDVYGEDAVIPGGIFRQWLPYKWSIESDDIVESELEKIGFYPSLPKKKITHRKEQIELEDDVYRSYAIDYGQELKKRFMLKVGSVQWDKYSAKRKIISLERIRRRVSSSARSRLIKHLKSKGKIE